MYTCCISNDQVQDDNLSQEKEEKAQQKVKILTHLDDNNAEQ
jgi:hypothetical protein